MNFLFHQMSISKFYCINIHTISYGNRDIEI